MITTAAPRISTPLVGVLEATWAAIVKRHPDVPSAVLVVASGTDGRKFERSPLGSFRSPSVGAGGRTAPRGSKGLPAEPVATLLHEAAHGLAHVRKIEDTSRQGRYHNRRYRALAEELGLKVAEADAFGWSLTTIPNVTIKQYRRELRRLQGALTLYRRGELTTGGGKTKSTNLLPCLCACPRRIRVARTTLEAGPIVCGICDEDFTVVQESEPRARRLAAPPDPRAPAEGRRRRQSFATTPAIRSSLTWV